MHQIFKYPRAIPILGASLSYTEKQKFDAAFIVQYIMLRNHFEIILTPQYIVDLYH